MSEIEAAQAQIRAIAKAALGADDDATCFRLATLMVLEGRGGYHRTPPAERVVLDLDSHEPVQ